MLAVEFYDLHAPFYLEKNICSKQFRPASGAEYILLDQLKF